MARTFDIRIVEYSLGSSTYRRVLETSSINFAAPAGKPSTLSFTASEKLNGELNEKAEYAVQVWNDYQQDWTEPEGGRFFTFDLNEDDVDETGLVTVTCQNFVWFHLPAATILINNTSEGTQHLGGNNNQMERWFDAPPGRIVRVVIDEAQAQFDPAGRWAKFCGFDFTWERDSAGEVWSRPSEVKTSTYNLGTTIETVLSGFVAQGYLHAVTNGRKLSLFNKPRGSLKEHVRIGKDTTSRPIKRSNSELSTTILAKSDGGFFYEHPLDGSWKGLGRRETVIDIGGIELYRGPESNVVAQKAGSNWKDTQRQYSAIDTPETATHTPFVDYWPGDTTWMYAKNDHHLKRIENIAINKDAANKVQISVSWDYLFSSGFAKFARAVDTTPKAGTQPAKKPTELESSSVATYGIVQDPIYGADGLMRVKIDGFDEWSESMVFKKLDTYVPAVGDYVYLAPAKSPEVYIVVGRMSGNYTEPPLGKPLPQAKFEIINPMMYGTPYIYRSNEGWIIGDGIITVSQMRDDYLSFEEDLQPLVNAQPLSQDGNAVRFSNEGPVWGSTINFGSFTYNNSQADTYLLNDAGTAFVNKDVNGLCYMGFQGGEVDPDFVVTKFGNAYASAYRFEDGMYRDDDSLRHLRTRPIPEAYRPARNTPIRALFSVLDEKYNFVRTDGSYNVTTGKQSYSFLASDGYPTSRTISGMSNAIWEAADAKFPLKWWRFDLKNGYKHGDFSKASQYLGPLEYATTADGLVVIRGIAYGGIFGAHCAQIEENRAPRTRKNFVNGWGGEDMPGKHDSPLTSTAWLDTDGKLFAVGSRNAFVGQYHMYAPAQLLRPKDKKD